VSAPVPSCLLPCPRVCSVGNMVDHRPDASALNEDAHTVEFEYMLPLGGNGLHKPWGTAGPDSSFPCCWGTLSETYAKLNDAIYFRGPPNGTHETLYLNLFHSSSVHLPSGAVLTQHAAFPTSLSSTTIVTLSGPSLTLKLRIPWWATGSNRLSLNGVAITDRLTPSAYLDVPLTDGDTLDVYLPLTLKMEQLADKRAHFAGYGAIMYGPLMLAALGAPADTLLLGGERTLQRVVVRNSSEHLSFSASSGCAAEPDLLLVPFTNLTNEHAQEGYTVYFHTAHRSFARTTPAGARDITFATASDVVLTGGASVVTNAADEHAHHQIHDHDHATAPRHDHDHTHAHDLHGHALGHATHAALENREHRHYGYDSSSGSHYGERHTMASAGAPLNLRSGDPGRTSLVSMAAPFADGGRAIVSIALSVQYVIGYGASGGTGASVALEWHPDVQCPTGTVLWTSPQLFLPSFDVNRTNYATLPVRLDGLELDVAKARAGALALRFDNGDHNMQVLMPLNFTLGWR